MPPTLDRSLVRQALADLNPGEGTAIGDAVSLAAGLGKRQRATDGTVPPESVLLLSDGTRDGGRVSPAQAEKRAKALNVPVSTVLLGTANGVVQEQLVGGYTAQIRVPPSPGTLQQVARATGGEFFRAGSAKSLASVYRHLATRIGHKTESREVTDLFAGGALVLLARGRRALGAAIQESPVRRAAVFAATCAVAAATAAGAAATNECRGLQVCVPVAGPWVVAAGAAEVRYQLACPKRFVVAGLDAELSSRHVDVAFRGALGSPVNPGITTSTSAVFLARVLTGHRPCRVPAAHRLHPRVRRRAALPHRAPSGRAGPAARADGGAAHRPCRACTGSSSAARPASASPARATRSASTRSAVPGPAQMRSVVVTQRIAGDRVFVTVRAAAASVRAVVQVDLDCAAAA